MKYSKVFVCVMITLSLGACACYIVEREYTKGFYWLCAACINISVVLM